MNKEQNFIEQWQSVVEEVKVEFCDNYCKYPTMPIPDGDNEDWIFNICEKCPMNRL